jgi:hypothetical protein
MHRRSNERLVATMIELSLSPIVLLLLIQPALGQMLSSQGVATQLQDLNHCQSVLALSRLDP